MKKVKLARLPDRVPVKMQVTLPPDLAARLRDYADLYAETYGVREEPADLVPYMLNSFLGSDADFRKAMREKSAKDEAVSAADQIRTELVSPTVDEPPTERRRGGSRTAQTPAAGGTALGRAIRLNPSRYEAFPWLT